ncbi:MAG: YihY/virulence factor BrkB family protein [Lachnospiraceae bacterium]|nr:YihY/virulence factor BrkB family protein [Lachnospiraceae bacterium]
MFFKFIKNIKIFLKKIKEDNINAFAAQTTFFIILSFIPFAVVLSSMIRLTPVTESMVLNGITRTMPDYISPFVVSIVEEVYSNSTGVISITAIVAIWSAAKGIQYLSNGLNVVNEVKETRSWLALRIRAVFYMFVFLIGLLVLLLMLVFGSSLKRMLVSCFPFFAEVTERLTPFRFLIIFFILIVLLTTIYKALPNNRPSILSQVPGAVFSAVAWYLFSFGLSIYVKYFNGFSMYGSLTTIVLVMLWLYFCIYIFLLCAEINYLFGHYFSNWLKEKKGKRT